MFKVCWIRLWIQFFRVPNVGGEEILPSFVYHGYKVQICPANSSRTNLVMKFPYTDVWHPSLINASPLSASDELSQPTIMPSDFSDETRAQLFTTYKNRCAICLLELPQSGGHCVHILDAASSGEIQVWSHNLAPPLMHYNDLPR